ncbi:hypothetical protein SASPL_147198 [Salvia splendens]|uniref:Uncharacterized protein n=1 Tax=Salvia splendens TaxID=180675 RepID=A0A8X8Z6H9_SALSN|nr:hypothetical protein SASPL_147198 [Salvia splendens]
MPLDQGQQGQADQADARTKPIIILLLRSDVIPEEGHVSIDEALNPSITAEDTGIILSYTEIQTLIGESRKPVLLPLDTEPQAERALVDNDSGIGSLHAHDEKKTTHSITITPGMRTIAIKSGVLAVLSNFYGLSKECPYSFLEEFCIYCDIQPVPAGSSSDDYRLKAIPFVLKGDAGSGCRASKTGSLKREITKARQEYDEPLGQYWDRFQGLLQACPNHKMGDRERNVTFIAAISQHSFQNPKTSMVIVDDENPQTHRKLRRRTSKKHLK